MRAVKATIDQEGNVRLLEPAEVSAMCKAFVVILDEDEPEMALLSEEALARDWLRPEEDVAWAHLQR